MLSAHSRILSILALAACSVSLQAQGPDQDKHPDGKGIGTIEKHGGADPVGQANGKGGSNNGIFYHGGPVMLGTTNIHYIFYGNWSGNSATTILPDLAASLGGSPYFNIETTYYNGANQ